MRKLFPVLLAAIIVLAAFLLPKVKVPTVFAQAASGCPSSTALGSVACAMASGTWAHITNTSMTGWGNGAAIMPPSGQSITEFADKALWNPLTNSWFFIGGSHTSDVVDCQETLFVQYTDSTSTWSQPTNQPCPNFSMNKFTPANPVGMQNINFGHAYENEAIDPATGNIF